VAAEASFWVGTEECGGEPAPAGALEPAPHWRLEAIAEVERPRSLSISSDGRRLLFVQDRDTSDVWLLDLDERVPLRVTTGRGPMPYWEDASPQLSPDGTTVAYVDEGRLLLVAAAGGPPASLAEVADVAWGGPRWISDDALVVPVEDGEYTRLAVVSWSDPAPRLLVREHGSLDALGDETEAAVSPDGTRVAYAFTPRADLNRSEIRVAEMETGVARALTGTPRMHDREPTWSPDSTRIAYASERSGWYELHLVGADGAGDRQLTSDDADFSELDWHPDGTRLVACRGRRGRFDLVLVDAESGAVEQVARGGCWGLPLWTADGDIAAMYEDAATAPQLRLVDPSGAREPAVVHAPTPLAVRAAPHVVPEEVSYRSFDGLEIPAFLFRPRDASLERPVPAMVNPHGGPTSFYGDEWDGHVQYFVDLGYAWLAPNFRGSTGYGREYERANHGVWGVADTKDCLAAAGYLRSLDWVDGERLGIFGASYGSYLALLSITDDPEHRFRCAVSKYGDCNIETSWEQGDRAGVLDLERMMGGPDAAPDAYRAGSPVHRLENVHVPILVAHGERDIRVNPKQSEELVVELRRLGKTYEYVTYPTEAHGFLRAGPQIDFYRRLERFLASCLR
jgi:dipeptidyl aminopeptidase/acylaminoacyl peptidase